MGLSQEAVKELLKHNKGMNKLMKKITIANKKIKETVKKYGTPFHIYDQSVINERLENLIRAFSWTEFKEFFAIKANPNPHILKIIQNNSCGVDAATITELKLAEELGFKANDIIFTSNLTKLETYRYAAARDLIVNIDYAPDIYELFANEIIPQNICFRLNPGSIENDIMGDSKDSKFGSTAEQIKEAVSFLVKKGINSIGLHTMVVSNETDPKIFAEYTELLFSFAAEIISEYKIEIDFINIGGGIGIPYRAEQNFNLNKIAGAVQKSYNKILKSKNLNPKIYLESGRYVTGEAGYLVTKVIKIKKTFKDYIGVDASMSELMRPAIYGSYHHLTNIDAEARGETEYKKYDVIGSLCENNDKFAVDRRLPKTKLGDLIVIHDTGAHGHSMGFNYNGVLRSGEFLNTAAGEIKQIRRAENYQDYTATIINGY